MMRDDMKLGDLVFFYHSNCEMPGIVDLDTSYEPGKPELRVRINRDKAADQKFRTPVASGAW